MEMVPIDCQGSLRQRALDEYAVSLKLLDAVKSRKKLRAEWVLSILMARDEVQRSMTTTEGQERSVAEMRRLIELDDRLRKGAGRMARVVRTRELERWRSTVQPAESAWWWWLERVTIDHRSSFPHPNCSKDDRLCHNLDRICSFASSICCFCISECSNGSRNNSFCGRSC